MNLRKVTLLFLALLALVLVGCGGGGGGTPAGGIRITGRVLNVATGGSLNPVPTIQLVSGDRAVNASIADGSFSINAPSGTTSLLVNTPGFGVFTFSFPAASQTVSDIGDLWVGPEKVTVTGRLLDAGNNEPVALANVSFGGQHAVTDSNGQFAIGQVGYSTASPAGFLGLVGLVGKTGYFPNEFTSGGALPSGGIANVGDVLLTPLSDTTPPPLPYNIWGVVGPVAQAPGAIVELTDTSGTVLRRVTLGSDGTYRFWMVPGSYRVRFNKGTLTAPTQNVTLSATNEVIRRDVTLG